MGPGNDEFELVSKIYHQTYMATGKFDAAFDAALERYCAYKDRRESIRSRVSVGVLISEAQMNHIRLSG